MAVLSRFWSDLDTDPDIYLALAQGLWEGRGYSVPGTEQPTAFRPPLCPLLLAPFSGPDQQWGRALLQLTLSLATLPLVWLTGRRLGLSLPGRLLAVGCIAVDPLLLRYVPFPMTETLCTFLIALLLWKLSKTSQTWTGSLVTGVLFGVCLLSRPTFWAFGILAAVAVVWQHWQTRRETLTSSGSPPTDSTLAHWLACGVGIALCVLPWGLRNWNALGSPVFMTTHGGYTLLLGNNTAFYEEVVRQPFGTIWDGSHGPGQAVWNAQIEEQMDRAGVQGELERDRWLSSLARDTIRQHPVTFLQACWLKFCWFWNVAPHSAAAHSLPASVRLGVTTYYCGLWILLLAGLGRVMLKQLRHQQDARHWLFPALLIVAMTAAHLFYWSDGRMRAPIMPAVALLAGLSISSRTPQKPVEISPSDLTA